MLSGASNDRLAFGPFLLEGGERRLSRDGVPVELSRPPAHLTELLRDVGATEIFA